MNESTNRRGLKTTTFQMRMDPEVKRQAEDMFAHYGLSLTDAVNIFIRQSLNRNGLPFILSPEDQEYQKQWAMKQLTAELETGERSAETGGWVSLNEAEARLGLTNE